MRRQWEVNVDARNVCTFIAPDGSTHGCMGIMNRLQGLEYQVESITRSLLEARRANNVSEDAKPKIRFYGSQQ